MLVQLSLYLLLNQEIYTSGVLKVLPTTLQSQLVVVALSMLQNLVKV